MNPRGASLRSFIGGAVHSTNYNRRKEGFFVGEPLRTSGTTGETPKKQTDPGKDELEDASKFEDFLIEVLNDPELRKSKSRN